MKAKLANSMLTLWKVLILIEVIGILRKRMDNNATKVCNNSLQQNATKVFDNNLFLIKYWNWGIDKESFYLLKLFEKFQSFFDKINLMPSQNR